MLFPKLDETCHTRTDSSDALPKFINMISLQPYTYHVLLGLSISAGGLTEHLVSLISFSFFNSS